MNNMSRKKSDWLGILGLIIGLIGLGSSYYFYKLSIKEREPILLEESFRPLLVEAESLNKYPLKIVDANGRAIRKDISSIRLYFWNNGGESIKKSDILKQIQIELSANDIQIIDTRILASSRPEIVQPKVNVTPGKLNSIDLNFDILERDDGITLQLLYAGTHSTSIIAHGTIEGVDHIVTENDLSQYHYYKSSFWKLGLPLFIALLLLVITTFFPFKYLPQLPFKRKLMLIVISLIITIGVVSFIISKDDLTKEKLNNFARESLIETVPGLIKNGPNNRELNGAASQ